ncbi:MAG: hypothetical protein NTW86_22270 [Candidatus Sumerlaeota bacterium]|nr:hypothetical protein [Candidatus Sumerlaeota bacterium]
MQSSRDLINRMMRGERPERVGLAENIWSDTMRRWIGEGYPVDEKGKPVDPVERFAYDLGPAGGGFDHFPLRGATTVERETDEWAIRRNGAGAALRYWKKKSGTPEHIDFRMTSREVWERDYRPHLLQIDRERLRVQATADQLARRRAAGRWALWGTPFIWEIMRQSLGDMCLYESLLLDPEWIRDFNRVYTDFFKAHYEVLFAEVGKPDGVRVCEDLGYKNGLFCSPKVLEELIFPYYRELVEFFHAHGVWVFLHSCGGVTQALDLIAQAGFDGLDPMEIKAGCDPLAFADKHGGRLVFRGGLDARVLESGDRDLIRREVARLIEGMKSLGARYVFGSDHSLSTNVSYPAYQYALEVYREHMMY